MTTRATLITGLVLIVMALACRTDPFIDVPGQGLGNAPGSPPDSTGPVSYGFDIQPIWDKNCTSCHRTDGIADTVFGIPMHLTSGQSYNDLVDQPSSLSSEWVLVVPGDAEASLLYHIVQATPPVGVRMPLLQPPLLDDEVELIRLWIEGGALSN